MLIDPDDPQDERILAALKRLQLTHLRETLAAVLSEAAKQAVDLPGVPRSDPAA